MTTPESLVSGVDILIEDLVPLKERSINLSTHKGFRKIVSSIQSIGLIEPLCVFQDNGKYSILDGFLRYKACQKIGIDSLPCIVYKDKEAYTYNRMVNRLSPVQEMKMIRKALGTIDRDKISKTFGMKSIKHIVNDSMMKSLHPRVVQALDDNVISRKCVSEFAYVTPERQLKILQEMERLRDFSNTFARALVLKTPEEHRNPAKKFSSHWTHTPDKEKGLVNKLKEVEERHDFYRGLYQQYANDLLKLSIYVRKLITNEKIKSFLLAHFPDFLAKAEGIVFDANQDGQSGSNGNGEVHTV
jgi:hypothetical protein